ncbi:MAG: DUF975 family protein [Tyzzerella sp.]|nr:DUF975 family protein [Tyzzerella sp.]
MWTRQLLKENGKTAFRRNYWACVAVSLILMILVGGGNTGFNFNFDLDSSDNYSTGLGNSIYSYDSGNYGSLDSYDYDVDVSVLRYVAVLLPVIVIVCLVVIAIAIAISAFLTNIIDIGGKRYFLENREHKTKVSQVLYGFSNGNYMNGVKIMFWKGLYIFGWSLLFIVPGIVKSYAYMMVPYILAENPGISKERAFQISMQMMDGHKMEAFILEWSFFGWNLLNSLTFGILGIFYVNPYRNATYAEFYSAIKAEAMQRGITDSIELPGVGYPEFAQQFTEQSTEQF